MLHPYGIQTATGLQAYHRQMAGRPPPDSQESAWIWTFWGRKLDLFLVPESGTKIGPGRGHFSKDYFHEAGNWTRFWCRNPAPKLVPDSAPDHDPKAKPCLPLKGNPSPASLRPVCRLGGGACHSNHPTYSVGLLASVLVLSFQASDRQTFVHKASTESIRPR